MSSGGIEGAVYALVPIKKKPPLVFDTYEEHVAYEQELEDWAMANIREIDVETTYVDGIEIQAAKEFW